MQQVFYRHTGFTPDKINDTVMGAPKIIRFEDAVRLSGKITVGEKEKFHRETKFFFSQKQRIGASFDIGHFSNYFKLRQ